MNRDCSSYREWISRSLDQRLEPEDTEALALHLAACPACRAAHEKMETGDELLRRCERHELPPEFEERTLRAARARSRASWKPAFTVAAAALVLIGIGILIAVRPGAPPSRLETLRHEVADHMSAVVPFVDGVVTLSGEDPSTELAFVKEAARAFRIKERTEALKRAPLEELPGGAEVVRVLSATESLIEKIEQGDAKKVREEARKPDLTRALEKVREKLQVRVGAPTVRTLAVSHGIPVEIKHLVEGQVALAKRDYKTAILSLGKVVEATSVSRSARLLRGDAYSRSGQTEGAVRDYTIVLTQARTFGAGGEIHWTTSRAARGIKALAAHRLLYVNQVAASQASQASLVYALAQRNCTLTYLDPGASRNWVVVAPSRSEVARTLTTVVNFGKSATMELDQGVTTFRLNPSELKRRLAKTELDRLNRIAALRLILGSNANGASKE